MNPGYAASFTVDQSAEDVFEAVTNVRGWWSEQIDGDTDKLNAVFDYHYQDVHRAKFRITELIPNKKVVWHVLDNHFNFIKDKTEWIGTDVVFEIVEKGDQTELKFTHVGLVPDYECYEVCIDAWGSYIKSSLRNLITTGQGQPNPIDDVVQAAREMSQQNYSISFVVEQTPEEVFNAINNVRGWWSEDIEGVTDQVDSAFKFRSGETHLSTQNITEFVPNKKVVWNIIDSQLNFIEDEREWVGTEVVFEIIPQGDQTELRFTHQGLIPALECYEACSNAWHFYVGDSLRSLITTGEGKAAQVETANNH